MNTWSSSLVVVNLFLPKMAYLSSRFIRVAFEFFVILESFITDRLCRFNYWYDHCCSLSFYDFTVQLFCRSCWIVMIYNVLVFSVFLPISFHDYVGQRNNYLGKNCIWSYIWSYELKFLGKICLAVRVPRQLGGK